MNLKDILTTDEFDTELDEIVYIITQKWKQCRNYSAIIFGRELIKSRFLRKIYGTKNRKKTTM